MNASLKAAAKDACAAMPASMDDPQLGALREAVRALCARFDERYWLRLDGAREYPTEFVAP